MDPHGAKISARRRRNDMADQKGARGRSDRQTTFAWLSFDLSDSPFVTGPSYLADLRGHPDVESAGGQGDNPGRAEVAKLADAQGSGP